MNDSEQYYPLIRCEKCNKETRHCYVRLDRRIFQCVEGRKGVSGIEDAEMDESTALYANIYSCKDCGEERGYGNCRPYLVDEVL